MTAVPTAPPFARNWQTALALVLVMEAGKNLSHCNCWANCTVCRLLSLRIAAALLTGKSPEEYAQEAGVTLNTVSSQLKNLFSKTDTHRQSKLVAALSRVPPLQN